MCLPAFMKNEPNDLPIYESLALIDTSFEQILQQLERLQRPQWFHRRPTIKSVELDVRETRAWKIFEILEIQHQREERAWTRFGRARDRMERESAEPRRHATPK